MNMNKGNYQKLSRKIRKPYLKPAIERIKLVTSETLAAGCKTESGGPIGGAGNCVAIGCIGDLGS